MSKHQDPYEHYEAEMFDGVIQTAEDDLNTFFAAKKKIVNSKYTTAKSKEAKLEPLKEGIK